MATDPATTPDPASVWPDESVSPPACCVTSSTPPAATVKLRDEATDAAELTMSVPAATVVGPVYELNAPSVHVPGPSLVTPSRPPAVLSASVVAMVLAPVFVPTSLSTRSVAPTKVAVLPPESTAGELRV